MRTASARRAQPQRGGRAGTSTQTAVSSTTVRRRSAPAAGPAPVLRTTVAGPPLLLDAAAAAAALSVSRSTLYALMWSGRLTPVRIGRSVRFTPQQLQAFVTDLERTQG